MEDFKKRKYSKDHVWIEQRENEFLIGVTDFAQKELGDIVYVDVESVDKMLTVGEIFGSLEAVKTVSDLFFPVTGKILEVNALLEDTPELINQSPYEKGWIAKIEVTDLEDISKLLTFEEYSQFVSQD